MNPTPEKSQNSQNEEKLLAFWREQNIFQKTLDKNGPASPEAIQDEKDFVFFEGPPTANGKPGIHHVLARSFKDVIPRYKTMQGFSVRRKAGWDTHGLPVELQVEKQLGLKSKKEIEKYGVAEFNKKCHESVWTYKEDWEKLTDRMGFWLDMTDPYVTYENSYIEAVWGIVKRAHERGHLYRDFRVGPWCARCGTGLSSHELNQPGAYRDVKDLSVFAKFPIIGFEKAYFLAWTTTPWTLPGNVTLAVGADIDYVEAKVGDEILVLAKDLVKILPEGFEIIAEHKGSEMVGMKYEPLYPFMNELVPGSPSYQEGARGSLEKAYQVYAADFVTTTDGTGIVHTAVMYGADDFVLGTEIGLPKFHIVNEEGKFIPGTGFLEGRFVKEKNEKGDETVAIDIIKDLAGRGLLFKKEKYEHSYPHCWRCDTPLIYYARTSWYFAMSKLRQQLLDANEKIHWEPDHIKEGRFGEWLDGIKDWAISRDRYWGTPLPVWATESGKQVVIGGLADVKKYAKKSGNKYFVMRHGQAESNVSHVWDFAGDPENHLTEEGKKQVIESVKLLKDKKMDVIIHSPLVRTTDTAQLVATELGFSDPLIVENKIQEIQIGGDFQGKPLEDFLGKHKIYNERYTLENPDGENYRNVKKRVMDFLYELEEKYHGKNILIVSHGSPILNMILGSQGMLERNTPEDIEKIAYPKNAEIRELDFVPLPHNENYELDFHKPFIDQVELELDDEKLSRTPEVMDVWFDSGSMPIAQDHKLGEAINFDPKPADYIAEGVDQTRGWFYTMHAIANMLHDNPTEAYKNVICMGLLMDEKGQKMSKSKGNVIEPWDMFHKYGADVVRFWFYSVNQPGDSKNFDEKGLDEVNKKVFNLLRNVVSFYEMYQGDAVDVDPRNSPNVLDQWVITLLDQLIARVAAGLDGYQVMEPARAIRDFVAELSQWYIRRSRDRFKSDDTDDKNFAIATTRYVLLELSKIIAPFTPFIAEEIFQKMKTAKNAESVHLEAFPETKDFDENILREMNQVREIVSIGLEARAKENIKVRQPLSLITLKQYSFTKSERFDDYTRIIMSELNVENIKWSLDESNEVSAILDINITQELKDKGDMRELVRKIQDMRKDAGLEPKDRVTVTLAESEPAWFGKLGSELQGLVGAEKIVWGGEDKVEKIG